MTEVSARAVSRPGRSIVSYKSGGRMVPMRYRANCAVCNSPDRFDIEVEIVAGRTYEKISQSMPEETRVSARSIKQHFDVGDMPLHVSTVRTIVNDRAERVGKSIENSDKSLVDGITLAYTVVQKTFEAIADGSLKPSITNGLQAAKILSDLGEYDNSEVDQQAFIEAFMIYHEEAQKRMTPEEFAAFGQALDENPMLAALASRYDGEEPVPGEVVSGALSSNPDADLDG